MPYEFYHCHPDDRKSCAACCGLYNYENYDRETIAAAMRFRTELFAAMKPEGDGLLEYKRVVAETDKRLKLHDEIYTCEFLGFVGTEGRLAGCMIHPAIEGGAEMRDCCYYGAATCAEHRCLAYSYFAEKEAAPVIAALDDWYLYGMCITDIDLIKEFYNEVSGRLYRTIDPTRIAKNPAALESFKKYLALKENWPYKQSGRRFGQYIFDESGYRVQDIDWKSLGMEKPREARILRSLGSMFENKAEAEDALSIIGKLVDEVAAALKD